MFTPSPDATLKDVNLNPEQYTLGLKEDGQPVLRRGSMGSSGVTPSHTSPEVQKAGEVVLKKLADTPNDPYLKACAQLILSKEHAGEVSPDLMNRLQAILTPKEGALAGAPEKGERERKIKTEVEGDVRKKTGVEMGIIGASARRGAAAGPTDEPVLGKAADVGRKLEIGALAEAALTPERNSKEENAKKLNEQFKEGIAAVRSMSNITTELQRIDENLRGDKMKYPISSFSTVGEGYPLAILFEDSSVGGAPARAAIYVDAQKVKYDLGFSAYDTGTGPPPKSLPYEQQLTYFPANFPKYNPSLVYESIDRGNAATIRQLLQLAPNTPINDEHVRQARIIVDKANRQDFFAERRTALEKLQQQPPENRKYDPVLFKDFISEDELQGMEDLSGYIDYALSEEREAIDAYERIPARFKAAFTREDALKAMQDVMPELPRNQVNYNEFKLNYRAEEIIAIGVNPNNARSIAQGTRMQDEMRKRGFDLPIAVIDNPTTGATMRIFANADDLRANKPMI